MHVIDGISKMSLRNTPPKHIESRNSPKLNQWNHRLHQGPRAFGNGHSQSQSDNRRPGYKGCRPQPPHYYTTKPFAVEGILHNGQQNGASPRRLAKKDQQITHEQPNQDSNQQSSPNTQKAQHPSYNTQKPNVHKVNWKTIPTQIHQNAVQNQKERRSAAPAKF